MNVEVRMFMKFREYLPPGSANGKAFVSLRDGSTFEDLLRELRIPLEEPKLVVINGISQGIATEQTNAEKLKNGDILAIFQPAGGG